MLTQKTLQATQTIVDSLDEQHSLVALGMLLQQHGIDAMGSEAAESAAESSKLDPADGAASAERLDEAREKGLAKPVESLNFALRSRGLAAKWLRSLKETEIRALYCYVYSAEGREQQMRRASHWQREHDQQAGQHRLEQRESPTGTPNPEKAIEVPEGETEVPSSEAADTDDKPAKSSKAAGKPKRYTKVKPWCKQCKKFFRSKTGAKQHADWSNHEVVSKTKVWTV